MDLDETLATVIDLSEQGKFAEARALLEEIAAQHPDAAEVFVTAGTVFWAEDRLEEATNAFRQAVALAPSSETASLGFFQCLCMQRDEDAARDEANRFLSRVESPAYRALLQKLEGKEFDFDKPSVPAWRRWLAVILFSIYPAIAIPLSVRYVPEILVDVALLLGPACLLWTVTVAYAMTGSAKAARHAVVLGCLVSAWHSWSGFTIFGSSFRMGGGPMVAYDLIWPLLLGFFTTIAGTIGLAWSQYGPD